MSSCNQDGRRYKTMWFQRLVMKGHAAFIFFIGIQVLEALSSTYTKTTKLRRSQASCRGHMIRSGCLICKSLQLTASSLFCPSSVHSWNTYNPFPVEPSLTSWPIASCVIIAKWVASAAKQSDNLLHSSSLWNNPITELQPLILLSGDSNPEMRTFPLCVNPKFSYANENPTYLMADRSFSTHDFTLPEIKHVFLYQSNSLPSSASLGKSSQFNHRKCNGLRFFFLTYSLLS